MVVTTVLGNETMVLTLTTHESLSLMRWERAFQLLSPSAPHTGLLQVADGGILNPYVPLLGSEATPRQASINTVHTHTQVQNALLCHLRPHLNGPGPHTGLAQARVHDKKSVLKKMNSLPD